MLIKCLSEEIYPLDISIAVQQRLPLRQVLAVIGMEVVVPIERRHLSQALGIGELYNDLSQFPRSVTKGQDFFVRVILSYPLVNVPVVMVTVLTVFVMRNDAIKRRQV